MGSVIITRWARCAARATSAFALSLAASTALAQTADQAAPPSPAPSQGAVQTQQLTSLDLWSAAGRSTGLKADLWRDTSPELARNVLGAIPDHALSPAIAALARRVLATGANAPQGAGSDPALAALRIRALVALGDLDAAEAVLARTPSIDASEPLSHVKAEVALLAGRDSEACDTGRALQQGRDAPWWLKLRAYCSLVDKQPAAAQVTMDLWRQGGGRSVAFERLMNAAANGTDPGKAAMDDPLDYALSRRLGLDMAAAVLTAPAAETSALARDTLAPLPARLEAAARALRQGAIPIQTVRELYLAAAAAPPAPTPNATLAPPPNDPAALAADPSARGEAGLYALAAQSPDLTQREAAITALLGRSKTNIDFIALSDLVAPQIAELVKAGAPLRNPVLFSAASALAGDARAASAIRAGIQESAGPSTAPLDLALLDALIAERAGQGQGPALDRLIERGGAGDPATRGKAQAAALLLAATDVPMSARALAELAGFEMAPARTSPARLTALDAAADGHRAGAAALIAITVAQQAPQGLSMPDRAAIAGALARAGLSHDAKDVVAQGLLALMGR